MRIRVKENERALLFKKGQLDKILSEGDYSFFDFFNELSYEICDISYLGFHHVYTDVIVKKHKAMMDEHFALVDNSDSEVSLVYADKKIFAIVSPSERRLFWKDLKDIEIEKIDVLKNPEISKEKLEVIVKHAVSVNSKDILFINVKESFKALLYVDGKFKKILEAGNYAYWNYHGKMSYELIDMRLQHIEVSGQEILTKEKVAIRANIECYYKILDPAKVLLETYNFKDYLYKEIQFAIREILSSKSLEELLSVKDTLDKELLQRIEEKILDLGIKVERIAVKDIILPGEMREMMNKVMEAEKIAQANIIKRREETAATRSLLNTAKLMDQNPTLMRLKELETLEKLMENVENLNVYGGFEGILNDFIKKQKEQ